MQMKTNQTHIPRANNRKAWDALPAKMADEIRARAKLLHTDGGYVPLTATQYMAYAREGNRTTFVTPYFSRRHRLIAATLATCVLGDSQYLDMVTDGLWTLCEESTWCLNAHDDSGFPLPDVDAPTLDLFAAQSGALVSWVCYLLEDRLLPLVAQRVRKVVFERVLTPFIQRDDFWWMGLSGRALNNWTPWILSNVLACARIWGEDIHARAATMLNRWLEYIPEDGGLDEGVSYWSMAGGSLLDCLDHLGVDRYGEKKIQSLAAFPLHMHIADDYYFNFADCDAMPTLDGERVYTFGKRIGNESLMALGSRIWQQNPAVFPDDTPEFYRRLCSLFTPVPTLPAPKPAPYHAMPHLQLWIRRNSGLTVAIKGGHNDESHNHNDIGSFIVYVDGTPAIVDAGNMTYTRATFDPATRYTLWNTRSGNHNLPILGSYEQCEGKQYCAQHVAFTQDEARMDIAAAYPKEAGALQLERVLRMEKAGLLLTDSIRLKHPLPIRWVFLLRDEPVLAEGSVTAGFIQLRFPTELSADFSAISIDDIRMARNYPGKLYRLVLQAAAATEFDASFQIEGRIP